MQVRSWHALGGDGEKEENSLLLDPTSKPPLHSLCSSVQDRRRKYGYGTLRLGALVAASTFSAGSTLVDDGYVRINTPCCGVVLHW